MSCAKFVFEEFIHSKHSEDTSTLNSDGANSIFGSQRNDMHHIRSPFDAI